MHGYLSMLLELNEILETLKRAHVIIIDEISMMTNVMLYAIEQRLKQAHNNSNPFEKMLVLVGDTKQLPTIC
jgi:nucleoside-triphosphatase THEP1